MESPSFRVVRGVSPNWRIYVAISSVDYSHGPVMNASPSRSQHQHDHLFATSVPTVRPAHGRHICQLSLLFFLTPLIAFVVQTRATPLLALAGAARRAVGLQTADTGALARRCSLTARFDTSRTQMGHRESTLHHKYRRGN